MIRINLGGRDYDSWDALPEEVRAQLLAAGVDPGPDGRLDSIDLSRAGAGVTRRTVVTGPDGEPLPPVASLVLTLIADALGSALRGATPGGEPMQPTESIPPPVAPKVVPVADSDPVGRGGSETNPDVEDMDPARSRRVPLTLGWIIIAGTVLLVATVVVIGLSAV